MTKQQNTMDDDRLYLNRLPKAVPPGRFLCHNHVVPRKRLGAWGFRAWTVATLNNGFKECPCGWAGHLGPHYARSDVAEERQPGQYAGQLTNAENPRYAPGT